MGLVRTWARWTSTALGASLLLPGAVMVVAAGVAVGGGGVGGLRALDQLVSGPGDPLAAIQPLDSGADALAASPSALIAALPPAASSTTPGAATRPQRRPGGRTTPVERERDTGEGGQDAPDGDAGPDTPASPPPAATPPPAPGGGVEEIPSQLPPPVGPLGGELIDQVVELGEQVLEQPRNDGSAGGLTGALGVRP